MCRHAHSLLLLLVILNTLPREPDIARVLDKHTLRQSGSDADEEKHRERERERERWLGGVDTRTPSNEPISCHSLSVVFT